jgi:hemerythrin-like domain-containing protein
MSADQSKPDLLLVNLIHQSLRVDAMRLSATVAALDQHDRSGQTTGVREFFERYREQLVVHHTHEDTLFFPALAARVGAERMRLSELADQHEQLDETLQILGKGLAVLADREGDFDAERMHASKFASQMVDQLGAHLTLEEETALPLFESEISVADYKGLETRARKATSRRQAQFMIPWVIAHATPEQQTALFRSAPPMRLVNRLSRGRYRRLDQALVPAAELSRINKYGTQAAQFESRRHFVSAAGEDPPRPSSHQDG